MERKRLSTRENDNVENIMERASATGRMEEFTRETGYLEKQAHGYGIEIRPDGSIRHDGERENDKPLRDKKIKYSSRKWRGS